MAAKKIALFIDADNISAKFGKQIIDTLESRGEIFIRRIYGNWEKNSLHSWNDCILNFSLRAVQQPDFVTGKNATDMSLTIDAMDVLHAGTAEIFALVSNDSDFTPLAIRLREGGVNIIGLGNSNASNAFRAACNEFIDLDATAKVSAVAEKKISRAPEKNSSVQMSLFDIENHVAPKSAAPNPKVVPITAQNHDEDKFQVLHDLLKTTAQLHGDSKGFTAMCWAGQTISSQKLNFSVKDFGYGSLHSFVADFPDRYEIIQRDNGENFCYRCRNIKPTKSVAAVKNDANLQKMHDVLREALTFHIGDDGFANLCSVGTYIIQKKLGFGVKNLGYSSMQKFLNAFPNLYDVRKDGHQIFLRCRDDESRLDKLHELLRQTAAARADENGFADLSCVGNSLGKQKIGFGIRDLGYSTLQKFVAAFPDRYELRKDGDKIFLRCRDDESRLDKLHELLRQTAAARADENGFADLSCVGNSLGKQKIGFGIRDLGYSTLQKFVAAFPDRYELRKDGDKIFLRCRDDESRLDKLHELLRQTAVARADENGFADLSCVGNSLGKQKIGFGIRDLGYSTLQKFVAAFPDRYELRKTLKKIFYRCRDVNGSINDDKLRQLHNILRESATLHADADGFSPINHAGQELKNKHLGFGIRNFGYGQLREFVADFPDLYEISHDIGGNKFRYRCKRA